jgi:hypothetical protein
MRLKLLVVLGSLTLIVAGWIFLSRLMRLGYVDSAIGSMRTLVAAETKYAQAHPEVGYTCSMSALPSDGNRKLGFRYQPRQLRRNAGRWLELYVYSQVPVSDIPAMKPAASRSQSCNITRLTANQRSPFILQTQ